MNTDTLAVAAHRLSEAFAGSSIEDLTDALTADSIVWHNFDDISMDRTAFCARFGSLIERMPNRSIHDIRRSYDGNTVIQQHVVEATTAEGLRVRFAACMVLTVRDGRVSRVEEYVDRGNLVPVPKS